MKEECEKEGLGTIFKLTAPGTPQQNGRVERKFATLYAKVRAMMNGARVPAEIRSGLWAECARTATLEENILSMENNPIPPYKLFHGIDCPLAKNLRIFGEMAVIANVQEKVKAKLTNRGETMMFIGYATSHQVDVFRFFNPKTKSIKIC